MLDGFRFSFSSDTQLAMAFNEGILSPTSLKITASTAILTLGHHCYVLIIGIEIIFLFSVINSSSVFLEGEGGRKCYMHGPLFCKLSFIVFSCKNITDHYHIPCPNCLIPFIHYWCSNHFQIKKKKNDDYFPRRTADQEENFQRCYCSSNWAKTLAQGFSIFFISKLLSNPWL